MVYPNNKQISLEKCTMPKLIELLKIYPESFRANIYSIEPFRMIGLIDVSMKYTYGTERVTLAYYRSSGTNNGKIIGLWYPIVGIKTSEGGFTEFTDYLNFVLTHTTRAGGVRSGWLAKSLFFAHHSEDPKIIRGFSNGRHYDFLLNTGMHLRELYEANNYYNMKTLNAIKLNSTVTSTTVYENNRHSQRENFERFIEDIFNDYR